MKDAVVLGPAHDRIAKLEHDKTRLLEALRTLYDFQDAFLPLLAKKMYEWEGAMSRTIKLLKELEK